MKKLLLSLAFATALTAPAVAGDVSITNSLELDQIGVNNAAITIQNVSGDDVEIDDDAFKNIDTALDLGELEIQNIEYIIGDDNEIAGVQNINDEVRNSSALNADDVEDVRIDFVLDNSSTDNTVDNSSTDNTVDNSTTDNTVDNSTTDNTVDNSINDNSTNDNSTINNSQPPV